MTVSVPRELPDNLPACHAVILRQAEVIDELLARIDRLERDLATLKRQLFGSRRERFVADSGEDQAEEDPAAEQRGLPPEMPADESPAQTSAFAPAIVLSGHIHNAPFYPQGAWVQRIGATWAFNPGRQLGGDPAVLRFDFDQQDVSWSSQDGVERQSLLVQG